MSLLKAYLQNPRTQRALTRKPGEKGFSLIELVVVVAVLAILAAVAIPSFTGLSDDARLNSTKQILANAYKECEYNKARTGTGKRAAGMVDQTPNGVTYNAAGKAKTCGATDEAVATIGSCTFGIELANGDNTDGAGKVQTWPANFEDC